MDILTKIEYIVQKSKINDLPNTLIHNETHKMIHELEHSIQQQGMDMAGYLKSIKKTKEDLEKDFKPQARERIKAALILRQISQEEKIKVTDKEIDEYLQKQKEMYKDNKEALKNLNNSNYRLHILNILANKKVIEFFGSKDPISLEKIILEDTINQEHSELSVSGAFIAIGHNPATSLFVGNLPSRSLENNNAGGSSS